jgi:hydrogenase expression/formation protein HypE
VATALCDIASASNVGIHLFEDRLPFSEPVSAACEILGLDPLYVANEGKCLAIVDSRASEEILHALREHPLGRGACIIGEVTETHPGRVFLKTRIGGTRILSMLTGEQLPRIC